MLPHGLSAQEEQGVGLLATTPGLQLVQTKVLSTVEYG